MTALLLVHATIAAPPLRHVTAIQNTVVSETDLAVMIRVIILNVMILPVPVVVTMNFCILNVTMIVQFVVEIVIGVVLALLTHVPNIEGVAVEIDLFPGKGGILNVYID